MYGKIIILVAPSGSGKTTLAKRLLKEFPSLKWSTSTTTRAARSGEVHGEDYFFLNEKDFKKKIDSGDFIEWVAHHGNFYGTDKKVVENTLKRGEFRLFDVDTRGADKLIENYPNDCYSIFISPPSLETLEVRLRKRKTESEENLRIRLGAAREEMKRRDDYDIVIVNDDIESAYRNFKDAIGNILECKKS